MLNDPSFKLWRFAGVGTLGFSVDFVVFFLVLHLFGWHYVFARVLASLIALTTTWLLNRRITFRRGSSTDALPVEFLLYLMASLVGMLANLGAFALIVPYDAGLWHLPAYILGATAGLIVNFLLYDRLVFRSRPKELQTESD